ncbi:hypothetical protein BJV78DRAFT_1164220 [Lactifluus subvellereus]|nr:hypothetical protein BJV78DRAFT_1164220 [Lactifluus subvellereus]
MPRVVAHFKHPDNFTDVGNGKWLCDICKADAMTVKQAVIHEGSAQHSSKADVCGLQGTSSTGQNPTSGILASLRMAEQGRNYWMDWSPNLVSFWRRGLEAAERGEEAESMHEFLDKLERGLAEQSRQVQWGNSPIEVDGWGWGAPAEDWTPTPDAWASERGKPPVAGVPSHVRHLRRRREGSSSFTSMHREGTVFDSNNAHDDEAAAFVENFLQCHTADARHRERMRIFYAMPTDQKVRKIEEVIRDLRGQ